MRVLIVGLVFLWTAVRAIIGGLQSGAGIPDGVVVPLLVGVGCVFVGVKQLRGRPSRELEDVDAHSNPDPEASDTASVRRLIAQKRQAREAAASMSKAPASTPRPVPPAVAPRKPALTQSTPGAFSQERLERQRKEIQYLEAQAQAARKKAQAIQKGNPSKRFGPTPATPRVSVHSALRNPEQLRILVVASNVLGPAKGL